MTVFRAVETWLCARREEMAKEGERAILVDDDTVGILGHALCKV